MMPELGKYATAVMGAYGVSILLIAGLVGMSLWKSARTRRTLEAVEARKQ